MIKFSKMALSSLLNRFNRIDNPIFKPSRLFKLSLFFIALFILTNLTGNVLAQQTTQTNEVIEILDAWQDGVNLQTTGGKHLPNATLMGLTNMLTGIETVPREVFEGDLSKIQDWKVGGALGSSTNLIASLYTPPASGVEYLAQIKDSFLGKPAYAQGTGFIGLQPLLPIWKAFRNVVYLLSSIVFIIIGIMIMLRVKISPQAVISIQNAIPQLITTLILVTFSYAIAGLLVDVLYFFQSAAIALLYSSVGKSFSDQLLQGDIIKTGYDFQSLSDPSLGTITNLAFLALPKLSILLLSLVLGAIVGGIIGATGAGAPVGLTIAGLGWIVILLIVSIFVLIWILSFFFGLLKSYITVIFKIVTGPLEIGLGAFPSAKIGFSSWLTDLVANLAVFPISLLFLVIGNLIIQSTSMSGRAGQTLWAPGMINESLPGTLVNAASWASGGIIPVAFGLALLMLLSKLPEMIPQFIFMLKPSPWGQAIGQGLKPIDALAKTGMQTSSNYQKDRYQETIAQGGTPTTRQRVGNTFYDFLGFSGTIKR